MNSIYRRATVSKCTVDVQSGGSPPSVASMSDPAGQDSLVRRFGTARHPERAPVHPAPEDMDDDTVDALGKLSAALEVVEHARGHLYAFHRLCGTADLALQDAVAALRDCGQGDLAEDIDTALVGRDVVEGMWSFQIVEAYDDQYWSVFRAAEQAARAALGAAPHLYESRMKADEQHR